MAAPAEVSEKRTNFRIRQFKEKHYFNIAANLMEEGGMVGGGRNGWREGWREGWRQEGTRWYLSLYF